MKQKKNELMSLMSVCAAYSIEEEERLRSSSGGIFRLLAEYVLSVEGVVYGVAMSEECRKAHFVRVSDSCDIVKLQGSKYLQASVGDAYRQVKMDLEVDKYVMFSGTGCQINGLKYFLGKEYSNLFCVDVLCHGTPSPALWNKYVDYIENENQAEIVNVNFRCKDTSWSNFGMKVILNDEKQIFSPKDSDPYLQMFLRNYSLRPSCYQCVAKRIKRSDMTIADFWGINNVDSGMNDEKGVSLIIIRTAKGMSMFEKIGFRLKSKSVTYEEGVRRNVVEYKSVKRPLERNVFFADMHAMDFKRLKEKYAAPLPVSMRTKIKKIIKKNIKAIKNPRDRNT